MKITCVCPTANRPEFLTKSIKYFIAQDFKDKELIILDDGKVPYDKRHDLSAYNVQYIYRGPKRRSIGAKTNALIDETLAEVICKWDDDDWYAPNRLSDQFNLIKAGAKFVGYHTICFWDERYNKAYKYFNSEKTACGTSFMFTAQLWCTEKFEEMVVTGTDNLFLEKHQAELVTKDGSDKIVALLHNKASNIEAKTPEYFKKLWQYTEVDKSEIQKEFFHE